MMDSQIVWPRWKYLDEILEQTDDNYWLTSSDGRVAIDAKTKEWPSYHGNHNDVDKIISDHTYEHDSHEKKRETMRWGTYGKSGKEPFQRVLVKDMTDEHISAILETQGHIPYFYRDTFKEELRCRTQSKFESELELHLKPERIKRGDHVKIAKRLVALTRKED